MSCGGGHLQCTVKMSLYFQASILSQDVSPYTLKTDHILMVSITFWSLSTISRGLTLYFEDWPFSHDAWILSHTVSPYTSKTDHLRMVSITFWSLSTISRGFTLYFADWPFSHDGSHYILKLEYYLMQSHLMLWVSEWVIVA